MAISYREIKGKTVICKDGVYLSLTKEQISELREVLDSIDEPRDMERLLIEARDLLVIYSNNDVLGCGGDELVKKINGYFEP